MMAQKRSTLNMPRLEMVKEPPVNSCGCSLLALALPASSLTCTVQHMSRQHSSVEQATLQQPWCTGTGQGHTRNVWMAPCHAMPDVLRLTVVLQWSAQVPG